MIEIDTHRYAKTDRAAALAILEKAQLLPDKLIAHRNRTFTARYHRDQAAVISDARIESVDHRVAIFKRPSAGLDRGRYVTLTFALAQTDHLAQPAVSNGSTNGVADTPKAANGSAAHTPDTSMILKMLQRMTDDMLELIHYADELTAKATHGLSTGRRPEILHLKTTLDELESQAALMKTALRHLG